VLFYWIVKKNKRKTSVYFDVFCVLLVILTCLPRDF